MGGEQASGYTCSCCCSVLDHFEKWGCKRPACGIDGDKCDYCTGGPDVRSGVTDALREQLLVNIISLFIMSRDSRE